MLLFLGKRENNTTRETSLRLRLLCSDSQCPASGYNSNVASHDQSTSSRLALPILSSDVFVALLLCMLYPVWLSIEFRTSMLC